MATRYAFTAAEIRNGVGLKRYLMNRSSRLLLNLLFWFAKVSLIREAIVLVKRKRRLAAKSVILNLSPVP